MKSLARSVVLAAAMFIVPSLALAAPSTEFKTTAPRAAKSSVHPGLWFTIKNECSGAAYATVGDNVCLLRIGTATFMTKIRSGEVPAGYNEDFNACAAKTGGDGEIMFVPAPGTAIHAVVVPVKPDSTVAIPKQFCK